MITIKNKSGLIANGKIPALKKARKDIFSILECTLNGLDPCHIIKKSVKLKNSFLSINNKKFNLNNFKNIYIVGAGKAAYRMALALELILGSRIAEGHINILSNERLLKNISFTVASHPFPDEKSIEGTKKIIKIAEKAGKDDLVIALISGGGSALMCMPAEGISLKDKVETTKLLIKSKAPINEINAVRKHLSSVKGGLLAKHAYPATLISLVISDVVGDDLGTIASGLAAPDSSTFKDTKKVLKKHDIWNKTPVSVRNHIEAGIKDRSMETPKGNNKIFGNVSNFILCSHDAVMDLAEEKACDLGYSTFRIKELMHGEAKKTALKLVSQAGKISKKAKKPFIAVAAGETVVKVKTACPGGRNQEFVLASINKLSKNMIVASLGTDGVDGVCPMPVAGAIADFYTKEKAVKHRLNIKKCLATNDSYIFFAMLKDNIITGPTGTNVGDIVIIAFLQ